MAKKIEINSEHRLSDLTAIAKTASPVARQLLGKRGFLLVDLLSAWQEIVGAEIASYTLPQKITFPKDEQTNGCLLLAVSAGAFAIEIKQKENRIIDKINVFFGYPAISSLKISQTDNVDNFLIAKKQPDKLKKKVVSAEEESYITEVTGEIKDNNLRNTLENIGRAVFSKKHKQE